MSKLDLDKTIDNTFILDERSEILRRGEYLSALSQVMTQRHLM